MAEPPKTAPHSDIEGVNRDARAGTPSKSQHPEPGSTLDNAKADSTARPEETPPEK